MEALAYQIGEAVRASSGESNLRIRRHLVHLAPSLAGLSTGVRVVEVAEYW